MPLLISIQNEKYLLMDAQLYLWTFRNFIYEHLIRHAHRLNIEDSNTNILIIIMYLVKVKCSITIIGMCLVIIHNLK